jgi:hypothetical protein
MPASAQTVAVPYPGVEAAGDFNVIVVGWNGSMTPNTPFDTAGNVYQLAIGPTIVPNNNSQAIYYAANIKVPPPGTANTVTVGFNTIATYPDIRILEYQGVAATNPVDVTSVGSSPNPATSTLPTFVPVVTSTYAPDLLVAANTGQGFNTTTPGQGFTQRILTHPDSNIVEDRIVTVPGSISAASGPTGQAWGWVMQMVAFRGANAQPPDTTPPTVSIPSPGTGTGTVTVTVNATDDPTGTGVAGVLLFIDSIPFGTADTTPPYTFPIDTTKFSNGAHTLTANAWDYAGNTASSNPVAVTFSNTAPANPAAVGVISGLIPLPFVTVNTTLLPTGEVFINEGESFGWTCATWDPVANTINYVPPPGGGLSGANEFCSATEQMADGQMIIVGGQSGATNDVGITNVNEFNPETLTWTVLPQMKYPRWYPSDTVLQDGSLLVVSGEQNGKGTDALISEQYFPSSNSWTVLNKPHESFPYSYFYPHNFLLADGRVFTSATTQHSIVSQVLDFNLGGWTPVDSAHTYDGGSSVMYAPGKILKMGHWGNPESTTTAVATAYTIDMTAATPLWQQVGSMAYARSYHNATLLPDGTVLVTGGGPTTAAADGNGILPIELWSPVTLNWTTLASINTTREYHSEGLLLPDARVLISGGGRFNNDNESSYNYSCEIFAPPYLFKGARPTITTAPAQITYGGQFTVTTPDATSIATVSLIRYGAVTHGMNFAQRFIPLSWALNGANTLTVTAPANAYLAPPGNYLLFIVNSAGVPSIAATVHF